MFRSSKSGFLISGVMLHSLIRSIGAVTAMMTNPIWVVKTRMFTSRADSPTSYTGLFSAYTSSSYITNTKSIFADGLYRIGKTEGLRGLWRGSTLALFGVSNGALQFMAYEKMKVWGFEQKRKKYERLGRTMTVQDDKLVSFECYMLKIFHFDG